jgi:VWFA-related protein
MHVCTAGLIVRLETPKKRFSFKVRQLLRRKFRHSRQMDRGQTEQVEMRRLILLGILAILTLPAGAAKRVTVEQLEQSLANDSAAHRADAEIAHQIGQLELSERLTDVTLGRLAKKLVLGPRTALALQLVADQSAFLDPPAGELPATAPPDAATQQRMMDAARGYVVETVPHLPNFFVSRTTSRFDDSPQVLQNGDWPIRAGLHLLGSRSRNETFRDGKEVQDTADQNSATETVAANAPPGAQQAQSELGLFSFGEFGPVLAEPLADMARGKVSWSHWEETAAGLAAVYNYSVPKSVSHYEVQYCCIREDAPTPHREFAYGNRDRTPPVAIAAAPNARPFHETPGYHGNLFIDPATGAILRITLEAELKEGDPITRAAIVVQYGAVPIGDRTYFCPVRSLAFSMEQPGYNPNGKPSPPVLLLNETSFSHYHHLGTTTRMIAEAAETGSPNPASPDPTSPDPASANSGTQTQVPVTPPSGLAPPAASPSGTASQPSGAQIAANAPPAGTAGAEPEPPPPPQPVIPEISLTAANGVPNEPANALQPQGADFQLKLTSRLVDVGIVAYDKKGHPVKDLKAEDFEVYDNGRKQEVRFFSQFATEVTAAPAAAPAPDRSFSNHSPDAAAGPSVSSASQEGATVLLIDESHIAWTDMSNARQQILKFLHTVAPGERVGLYTMTGLGFKVIAEITTDHTALIARLQKWMPTAQSVSNAQDEETRNRQQINEVHNVADLNSVNGNEIDVADASTPVDPQLLTMGSNPARASLIILAGVARHFSAVAGHKNLVWVSSDNVFADWQNQQVGIDKSPKMIDTFAMHAQEAMNDAHVAVFPLDVSQLESAAIDADIQHRNVELTPAAMDTANLGGGQVPRNGTPGRITAEMQQDIRPIQGPIRQVADATGGRVIRRAGDLAAELAGVVEDGHATYMVSFSPQGPADDQYHAITIKLTGKQHGLTLHYRTGYLFAREPATLKDRFQQAVWRPRDVSEVAVTAGVTPMNPGANVKINIVASDLGLQQQAGRWMDKLDIFFIQRDDAGIHAQVEGQTLGLRLKSSTYQSLLPIGVPFEHFVQLRPGMASLRVLVVDENSGLMGSVTIPATALGDSH